jgi:hypothetical protein
MRSPDWLLIAIALAAIAVGLYANGPICAFNSAPVGQIASRGCRYLFPAEVTVGLLIAASATTVLAVRLLRRRYGR